MDCHAGTLLQSSCLTNSRDEIDANGNIPLRVLWLSTDLVLRSLPPPLTDSPFGPFVRAWMLRAFQDQPHNANNDPSSS
mgnify:FL=1